MRHRFHVACLSVLLACSTSDDPTPGGDGSGDGSGDGTQNQDGASADGSASDGTPGGDGMAGGDGMTGGDGSGDGSPNEEPSHTYVYVGGWDWSGQPYPFRVYELDRTSGNLEQVEGDFDFGKNPSFIMPSPDGRTLYITNEWDDDGNSGVTSAAIDLATGVPTRINAQSTGDGFVFASVDPSGKYVLTASYSKGTASVFPIQEGGGLDAAIDTENLGGNAHSIRVDASGQWAFVPNLQRNQVFQLTFDGETGQLARNGAGDAADLAGGPRHIALHPDGSHAYVMCEKEPKLVAYTIGDTGVLESIDEERTVPEGTNEQAGAHVLVHPSGRTVYVSNRNQTSIAVFRVAGDGTLEFVEHEDTRGVHPRNFDIDATGKFLVVANKGGDGNTNGNLAVFAIAADGTLSPLGDTVDGLKEPTGVAIVNVP